MKKTYLFAIIMINLIVRSKDIYCSNSQHANKCTVPADLGCADFASKKYVAKIKQQNSEKFGKILKTMVGREL